jgi:hypothetical protein
MRLSYSGALALVVSSRRCRASVAAPAIGAMLYGAKRECTPDARAERSSH